MSNKKQRNAAKKARKKQQKLATQQALKSGEYYTKQECTTCQFPQTHELLDYTITWDPLIDETTKNQLPKEIEQQKEEIFYLMEKKNCDTQNIVQRLESLHQQYPNDKTIANFLAAGYSINGDKEKYQQLIKENFEKWPEYLFARFNVAQIYIKDQQPEKVYDLFDGKLDLKLFCPERDVFHISEVKSMIWTAAYYAALSDNEELFLQQLKILMDLDPDCSEITSLTPFVFKFRLNRLLKDEASLDKLGKSLIKK